ncbi:MAG: 4Fe-4S dicluster domain-containing protein, partial [Polyangiales bacterium]
PPTSSLLTRWLIERLQRQMPRAEVRFDPTAAPIQRWRGAERAFGQVLEPHYDLKRARVIVALDADFLTAGPVSLRWARHFAQGRRIRSPDEPMSRLYHAGPAMDVTASRADERLPIEARRVHDVALALLEGVGEEPEIPQAVRDAAREPSPGARAMAWVRAAAGDLLHHRGRAVVVAGDEQPASVHVLAHALNELIGSHGETASLASSPLLEAGGTRFDPEPLLDALGAGEVRTLAVGSWNPAYAAPFRDRWRELAPKADAHAYLCHTRDESAELATWVLPRAHFLEAWGDGRAYDGTRTLTQPLIDPLYGSRTLDQLLALLAGRGSVSGRALLAEVWDSEPERGADLASLDRALADGLVTGSAFAPRRPGLKWDAVADAAAAKTRRESSYELLTRPDARVRRGTQANNPWLQETPDPVTKVVWDNAATLSPADARDLGVEQGDVVRISTPERSVEVPALPQPGQAEGTVVVALGYGQRGRMSVASDVGADVAALRADDRPGGGRAVRIERTGARHELVTTQQENTTHDRPIVLHRSLDEWAADPDFAHKHDGELPTLYPKRLEGSPQWGMAIDLAACTGCSACVVACQVENNTPVVGKGQVAIGREMHWLRIDRYYTGEGESAQMHVQPMLCQHCEDAPCEYVCPVNATVHSPDGLNEMVYNRCVGTRFCSNNCPYKVRRFNFLEYNGDLGPTERMGKNPDVTVRARGVMEKCTYCVQRIRRTQIEAQVERRSLRRGEVRTACQQACPSRAISFGRISDPDAEVTQWQQQPRAYAALHELGTRPRTRYLAEVRNPPDGGEG